MSAMAFKMRAADVVIKEGVVLQTSVFDLLGREIQNLREHAKGILFVHHAHADKILNLKKEAARLLQQNRFGSGKFSVFEQDLFLCRKPGA